ncbi:hypothetical protein E2P71_07065 [Candidatus Bathyarchaeota archaeon]|nr:hypothetical protein E2P71_07065 [Candidatus Bathyarchaeota archaeon]
MIENACPYAPGEVKPEAMQRSVQRNASLMRFRNVKLLALLGSVLTLTLLYVYSYPSFNWEGSPFLFQDWYIVKMSLYTYLFSMITHYIREYQKQNRE